MGTLLAERQRQILPRGSKALQYFHANVEMPHECLILVLADDLVEEGVTGPALRFQDVDLALAGIHQKSDCQRKIRLA